MANCEEDFETLVLSGASSKGLLMLGALQCAYDKGTLSKVKTFIGVSAGAICCLLLIIGYSPLEILTQICTSQVMEKMKKMDLATMIGGGGAIPFKILEKEYASMIERKLGFVPTLKEIHDTFGKLFICETYNYTKKRVELVSHEDLPSLNTETGKFVLDLGNESCLVALRMTATLPFVFEPFEFRGDTYMDGGIADNFPVDIGSFYGEKILGILVAPERKITKDFLEFMYDLTFIPNYVYIQEKINRVKKASVCVVVNLQSDVKFYEFGMNISQKLDMFSEGYKVMEAELSSH